MQTGVYHKATRHIHYCLDSTLGLRILVLCSYAKKGLSFPFMDALLVIFFSKENTIITMVVFYLGISHIPEPLLKSSFAHYHLIGTK